VEVFEFPPSGMGPELNKVTVPVIFGRALLDQKRFDECEAMLAEAESSFDQLSSASHRAAAWVAQGDLAERRGDDKRAATLYKRAAEILQDFRF